MSGNILTLVVIAANVLGAAMALPQAAKLLESRRVEGISPVWAGVSATVNACWAIYGLGTGDLGIVPVSSVSVMAYLAIVVGLFRFGRAPALPLALRLVGSSAAVAVVPIAAYVLGGWPTAGIALGALYGVQLSPAVVAVYRATDVSGVSAATWAIALAEALLWGVYGFVRLDAGLLTLAATGTLMSTLVLARLFVRRPRRDRADEFGPLGLSPA
jgi:uncharacterized protein with PQ loop repeat